MRRLWLGRTVRWGLTAFAAALLAAWPLSGWWMLRAVFQGPREVRLFRGCLLLQWFKFELPYGSPRPRLQLSKLPGPAVLGMLWAFDHQRGPLNGSVRVPLWAIVPIPMAAAGLAWRGPLRAARRRRRSACLSCGYPRLGIAPEAPCPECGTVPGA